MNLELYRETVEFATSEIAQKVLATEPALQSRLLQLDGDLQPLIRAIGLAVTEKVMNTCANTAIDQARERGMTTDQKGEVAIMTVYGKAVVTSPRLRGTRGHRSTYRPVHAELGLAGRMRSEAVERALCDFGAEASFEQAARRFTEHYGIDVDRTSVLRIVHDHAAQAEEFVAKKLACAEQAFEQTVRDRPGVDEMLLGINGCMLRTGTLHVAQGHETTAVRGLPKRVRQTEWRDVRLALCRPLGEVEPTYVGAMDSYPAVVAQLFQAAVSRGLSSRTQAIAVADGGVGLYEELDAQFPKLSFILDKYHLIEHLGEAAEALGLGDDAKKAWTSERLRRLSMGEVDAVILELKRQQSDGAERCARLAKHLQRFRKCVDYNVNEALGWPVGSGETESAHRSIPQRRMKLPGAWWLPEHINPMMSLRIMRQNGWWGEYWAGHAQRLAA